jgi:nucleoid DNA-binding protein
MSRSQSTSKRMSKTQIIAELAERSGISKQDVQGMFDELLTLVERELGERGPGEFIVPDLVKLKVKRVPAKPAHMGFDPFTKVQREFPEKPASRRLRASPALRLKRLAG